MPIKTFLLKISSLQYFFWATLWLMILVIIGTLAQKNQGLYSAQNTYFSSWYFFAGPIPLPSGIPTMGIIFFGLLFHLIFKTKLTRKTLGIAITHLGALLLLTGGILTALYSVEGNMIIPEGQSANYFHDSHKLELSIINTSHADHDKVISFGEGWLEPGTILNHESLPFTLKISKFCSNTSLSHTQSEIFEVNCIPISKEDSENFAGIVFEVLGSKNDGVYSALAGMPMNQIINSVDNSTYQIMIQHKRYILPFTIELHDFQKKVHAGTDQAKSYKSTVSIIDDKLNQRAVIQMNAPLRYKGYTLYQSSYYDGDGVQTTVLSVVKNVGRLFPYISSIIICIGLLIHLLQNLPILFSKRF